MRYETQPEFKINQPVSLSVQEGALAYAMAGKIDDAVSSYGKDKNGSRLLKTLPEGEFGKLLSEFKTNPKHLLAYGRTNLLAIARDNKLSEQERKERVRRYVDAFLDLQIKLDRLAYPKDEQVKRGVPEYVPDGLTDMGSDPDPDPKFRGREKIRVDKKEIFSKAKGMFYEVFSQDYSGVSSERIKAYMAKKVAQFVHDKMPYDKKKADPFPFPGRSIPVSSAMDNLAVCRHHALVTQVLVQAFGLTGRLLKCDVKFRDTDSFGPHAANLVRIDLKWYLLDSTNPDEYNGEGEVFIRPVPEREVDLNSTSYQWSFRRKKNNANYTYKSRDNMYYKLTGNS